MQVSCHSLIEMANGFAPLLVEGASVVTVSISTTSMAAENYGYMAPVKAALDSSVAFLAKSFAERRVRFNAVCPGLLKTNASAGIPGYVDSYLYAERVIPRQRGVDTEEVASTIAFLLSRSRLRDQRAAGRHRRGDVDQLLRPIDHPACIAGLKGGRSERVRVGRGLMSSAACSSADVTTSMR